MKYDFSESILGSNICSDILDQIKILIRTGSSFNMIGMPFVGISPFFRYIATTDLAYMVYIDVHALIRRTKEDLFIALYKELGGENNISGLNAYINCKQMLSSLLKVNKRILIMINRFDYLEKEEFTKGIYTNLKSLEDIGKGKIIFAVASHKPLYEIDENAITDSNLAFLSKLVYFKPYVGESLQRLLLVSPIALKPNKKDIVKALLLSGGHATLLQVLIKTEYLENPLLDPFIKLHLRLIYDTCSTKQKNMLYKIAIGKKINEIDSYVLKVGIVKENGGKYELFSPLFRDYLALYIRLRLTKKEKQLFEMLKNNLGKTISKDTIFNTIWRNNPDTATDWALNTLIYRLRNNPTIKNKYLIENEKSIGYRMVKEF